MLMTTVTIPKEVRHKNLVAIPRDAYKEFLAWQKKVKSVRTFKPTAREKRLLSRARRDFARGNVMTIETLEHELGIERS